MKKKPKDLLKALEECLDIVENNKELNINSWQRIIIYNLIKEEIQGLKYIRRF